MNRKAYTSEDFAWVNWTPEIIKQKINEAIEAKKVCYAVIKAIAPSERTFTNTVFAIESSEYEHIDAIAQVEFLMHVSPLAEVRDTAQEMVDVLQKAIVDIEYDPDMYRAMQEYAAKDDLLVGADKELFDDMMRTYKRMGFVLEPEKQQTLKDNLKEIAELATGFEKAIADHQDHIVVRKEELRGLPEAYINGLKQDEEGNYIVTLAYPDYIPFSERCDSAPRRKELIDKFNRRGGPANIERLKRILELRTENAMVLGYPNHAAFKLEDRMAKTVEMVTEFYKDLQKIVTNPAKLDLQLLAEMKKKELGDSSARLAYYDIGYYIQRDKMQGYAVDDEVTREYFPLERVLDTMFDLYASVLGLQFVRENFPAWHESVLWYRVDNANGSLVGYFSLDLFPREGKYGHAMMHPHVQGRRASRELDAPYVTPTCGVVANFNPSSGTTPSLLSHNEVQTLFHEFGHAMHSLVTTAVHMSQAGTNTARDFVEAPSQMFEYWVWEREILKKMSKHYVTSEPLPDELIDRMIRSKNHAQGYSILRQLFLGSLDMTFHTATEPIDPVAVYADLYKQMFELEPAQDQLWPAGFGHLMHYDAGYYGYLWSEVYAADMFARFRTEGVMSPTIGMEYRKKILEVGSSRDEMESVKDFLGRMPNHKAFLADMGLASHDEKGGEASE
ncbi:MAG: Zn-dependent oligopeptidase [Candidatus Wolfebacteria bacterium GW2011_GWE2_44_13]|uniref:Zn-dependent oligopeptidase n=1 Tax=Candidatus Wolfebacteria bacterium GW2011_GWE2_44_13 TaxID=1619017 RepID=A0A0G1H835_9BACT|nr:MAG: Zn-dependent oligopeptidase [Candidatus Wolfebacteria bacterium GW2011_GWE2_44_13]